jgi:hypothetical protein
MIVDQNPMNFFDKELYELSRAEAESVLNEFLFEERAVFATLKIKDVDLDYSRQSVVKLFKYAADEIASKVKKETEFDAVWSLRLAFYFGESLTRHSPKLRWGIGAIGFAQENHPVITGFKKKQEAPLIAVSRNIISAVVFDGEEFSRVIKAVDAWFDQAN